MRMVRAAPLVSHGHHAPVKRDRQLENVLPPHLIYGPVNHTRDRPDTSPARDEEALA